MIQTINDYDLELAIDYLKTLHPDDFFDLNQFLINNPIGDQNRHFRLEIQSVNEEMKPTNRDQKQWHHVLKVLNLFQYTDLIQNYQNALNYQINRIQPDYAKIEQISHNLNELINHDQNQKYHTSIYDQKQPDLRFPITNQMFINQLTNLRYILNLPKN